MKRSILFVGVLFCALAFPPSSSGQEAASTASQNAISGAGQIPLFRSGIDLVSLSVTVTDEKQKYVPGLSAGNFQVFEDGVQQDISFFAAADVPLDVAILLDTSASMAERMRLVQEAACGFIRTLRAGDRAALIDLKDNVRTLQPFTVERDGLDAAIRATRASGGTALYNAIYIALKQFAALNRQVPDVRRQAIVVLSDGEDTTSLVAFDDVMELARRSGVAVYTISMKSRMARLRAQMTGDRWFSEADFAMKSLAQETGGLAFTPVDVRDLGNVYGGIGQELASQYALGYASKNPRRDRAYRRVIVRVAGHPGARPRTRSGYFAEAPTTAASIGGERD